MFASALLMILGQAGPTWPAVPGWYARFVTGEKPPVAPANPTKIKSVESIIVSAKGGYLAVVPSSGNTRKLEYRLSEKPSPGSKLLAASKPYGLALIDAGGETRVFLDGSLLKRVKSSRSKVTLTGASGEINPFAYAVYTRVLTFAEVAKNARAVAAFAGPLLKDTPSISIKARLGAFTEVPDPARIKPYRSALLAQEYTILSVREGHIKGLTPGAKVRVFRYGVWDGKRTALENAKTGDVVQLTIKPLASDPVLEREYQLDSLDVDVSATYYVEMKK